LATVESENQLRDSRPIESEKLYTESAAAEIPGNGMEVTDGFVCPASPAEVALGVVSSVGLELSASVLATGSHMLNSETQFWSVFTGTMMRTDLAPV